MSRPTCVSSHTDWRIAQSALRQALDEALTLGIMSLTLPDLRDAVERIVPAAASLGRGIRGRSPVICVMKLRYIWTMLFLPILAAAVWVSQGVAEQPRGAPFDRVITENARAQVEQGRQIFRFDTFGDEEFWGDLLRLHEAIERVSPQTA